MAVDFSPYTAARRGIRADYRQNAAVNEYSRFLSQQRGRRQISDYRRDWKRTVPQFTSGYGQRGLAGPGVRSGVYQQAMNNFLGDYQRNIGRMQQDYRTEMNQFDLTGRNLLLERNRALADVASAKAAKIAQAAHYLSKLKPLYS